MKRYALAVEYTGCGFCGWQRQKHCRSVQEVLEQALSVVADEAIEVVCAGRTDSGVHAVAQIVHFDTSAIRPNKAWVLGVNNLLPSAVSVHWADEVSVDFHARYSALNRSYRYLILNRVARPGLLAGRVAWVYPSLNEFSMHAAAQALVGEHDFSAFRAAGCQAKHAIREVQAVTVSRKDELVVVEITANAFLHNMVRIIVGNLIKVGRGEVDSVWLAEILAGRDRTAGGMTAEPDGLYFLGPSYPDSFKIPVFTSKSQLIDTP